MSFIASESGKDFKKVPEGNHMARCYRVIDMGTQKGEYQGEPRLTPKILIAWELFGEADDGTPLQTDDGRPLTVSSTYTLSLSKKAALRAHLESWRGTAFTEQEAKGFDVSKLLGAYCMVTIKHDKKGEKTYTNVASVSKWPSALKNSKPAAVNEDQLFTVDKPDMAVFEVLPDWMKEKINACLEWNKEPQPEPEKAKPVLVGAFDSLDDDIPF
jgi:hypothetical protein